MLALSTAIKFLLWWLSLGVAFLVGFFTSAILAASKRGDEKAEGIKHDNPELLSK